MCPTKSGSKKPSSRNKDPKTVNRSARRRRLNERLETLRGRVQLIEAELIDLTNDFFRVCIFGSARIEADDTLYKMTEEIARGLGQAGIDVLTGGGPGLMEAANKGLREGRAISGSKSRSFGLTIELTSLDEQPSDHLDIKHHHKKFSSRLDDFMRLSHAVIIVPGGIGTLLEFCFTLQLLQVNHLNDRPMILMNPGFWDGLINWIRDEQISAGLVGPDDLRWIHMVEKPEEALDIVFREYHKFLEQRGKK